MAGIVTLKCTVLKNGVKDMAMRNPIFVPGPVQPQFGSGRMLTVSQRCWTRQPTNALQFEGISVDENGEQHFLDATVACKRLRGILSVSADLLLDRQACINCVEYLKRFGYTGEKYSGTYKPTRN